MNNSEDGMLAFHIGGDEAELVRVSILREEGDGWFSAQVSIAVGAFRGSYPASFDSSAFSNFLRELEAMSRTVSGTARFTSYEAQLELELACDATGHIQLRGEAMDEAGTGNTLVFWLEMDQTYLPALIGSLQAALRRFPVRAV